MTSAIEKVSPTGRFEGKSAQELEARYGQYLAEKQTLEGCFQRNPNQDARLAALRDHLIPNLADAIKEREGTVPTEPCSLEKTRSRRGSQRAYSGRSRPNGRGSRSW